MLVIILVIIVIILIFLLIKKNGKNNNTGINMFLDNKSNIIDEDNIVKEKEKSNKEINLTNNVMQQNEFNPFIYDRLYNPFYTYTYPYSNYTSYPYYNYTYDIRPFPRQYPGRIYNYNHKHRNYDSHKSHNLNRIHKDGERGKRK